MDVGTTVGKFIKMCRYIPEKDLKFIYSTQQCEECGAWFRTKVGNRRYCSLKCRGRVKDRLKLERHGEEIKVRKRRYMRGYHARRRMARAYVCQQCGEIFLGPKKPSPKDKCLYCSVKCAAMARRVEQVPRPVKQLKRYCDVCGALFRTSYSNARYCGREECARGMYRTAAKRAWDKRNDTELVAKHCAYCGISFMDMKNVSIEGKRYCSTSCSVSAGRQRRRALKKEATVGVIDMREVYRRTNGRCGICGEVIDFSLDPGNKMAKTLDHIMPLSKGGAHATYNLQLAHRSCNSSKGASVSNLLNLLELK